MTIILAQVIHIERSMLIKRPAYSNAEAISHPRMQAQIIKDFVCHEAIQLQLPDVERMLNL